MKEKEQKVATPEPGQLCHRSGDHTAEKGTSHVGVEEEDEVHTKAISLFIALSSVLLDTRPRSLFSMSDDTFPVLLPLIDLDRKMDEIMVSMYMMLNQGALQKKGVLHYANCCPVGRKSYVRAYSDTALWVFWMVRMGPFGVDLRAAMIVLLCSSTSSRICIFSHISLQVSVFT